MSFISITLIGKSKFLLKDSEFGSIELMSSDEFGGDWASIANVYIERNLPVGRNLALAIIDSCKNYEYSPGIKATVRHQDRYCPKHIPNWSTYAKERDHHLEKLLALV